MIARALVGGLVYLLLPAALAADPSIPFEKYELPNGLDVVLAQDGSVPYACVYVRYEVGSRDETAGRSGFAHLFEHMMFQGSKHADSDYFAPLEKLGADVNGNTTLDRTVYFECVPSQHLPLALFLESDRMGWLPDALTQGKLDNQKMVVRNERRQRYEVPPYGEMYPTMLASVYPPGHPYHISTIGKHEDLEAATLADTLDFFRKWYVPAHATLAITGDFDASKAKELVETYFGDVPAGPVAQRGVPTPVVLEGSKRVNVEKKVPFSRVWITWLTPAFYAPGDAELDLVASVLTAGDDAPLYKALVRDQQIAQSVSARQGSASLQSMFTIDATAASGHTADELIAAIDGVLAKVRDRGLPAADIDFARVSYEMQFFGALRTIQGKAGLLADYNGLRGDPGYLAKDLSRYRDATVEGVNQALRAWLPDDRRVVLSFEPPEAP